MKKILNSKIFKIIITIILILVFLLLIVFALYKATIDVSDNNIDKFDYVLDNIPNNSYKIIDFLSFDSIEDPDNIKINIPKDYMYLNLIDMKTFSNELFGNENVKLNKIGIVSNFSNNNNLDYYLDVTYNNKFDAYVTGTIEIKFNADSVDLYSKKIVIGDGLPMFLYKPFLPFKDDELIYSFNTSDFKYTNNEIIKFDLINNFRIRKDYLNFKFKYIDNIEYIGKMVFGDNYQYFDTSIKKIAPILLELVIGNNSEEYIDFSDILLPSIQNNILD